MEPSPCFEIICWLVPSPVLRNEYYRFCPWLVCSVHGLAELVKGMDCLEDSWRERYGFHPQETVFDGPWR